MARSLKQIQKFASTLFNKEEISPFIDCLTGPPIVSNAILWVDEKPKEELFRTFNSLDWQPEFVDRIAPEERPGSHSLHEEGRYYCLDMSSVFEACALYGIEEIPTRILDMCASPGGKSIFAARLFNLQSIICNETIGKRIPALRSNLERCKIKNATILNRDPSTISELDGESFDLVIVDAPCSGQSLIIKGKDSYGCFHPAIINKNSNRQKRIIASAANCVRPGGYLAYMTCTFSLDENEKILEWLMKKIGGFQSVEVSRLDPFKSQYSEIVSYRMWPMSKVGAGGFCSLLRKL